MIYTKNIQKAILFSIQTHELDQKQKRKGKDIPYISHPLTVGLILARAQASEDVIIAGILHDTIEDSAENKRVTRKIIEENFGENVADLVLSVTEENKNLSWKERKAEALDHIKNFSNDSTLLKSADLISNVSEIIDDHSKDGDKIFLRFSSSKEAIITVYQNAIEAIVKKWSGNPLIEDLNLILQNIKTI